MSKPLLNTEKYRCYICGKWALTEKHHIFGGANRKLSEKYGLYVHLCHKCHNEPPNGVHFNPDVRHRLQAEGQKAWEARFGTKAAFMKIFGKNYREDE